MSRVTTKPTIWHVRPAKTQISLGIRPVWSESSLSAWRNIKSLATQWAHSEDWSDWADAQADPSLRWVHTGHFVVLSCCGSCVKKLKTSFITSLGEEGSGLYASRAFVCLFVCFVRVSFCHFLFLLVSGAGCGLWLWHSLDFSINCFER